MQAKILIQHKDSCLSEIKAVKPENGKTFKLEELQKIVGGLIEIIPLGDGSILVINEEGKLQNEIVVNIAATVYYRQSYVTDDFIAGEQVLHCPSHMVE